MIRTLRSLSPVWLISLAAGCGQSNDGASEAAAGATPVGAAGGHPNGEGGGGGSTAAPPGSPSGGTSGATTPPGATGAAGSAASPAGGSGGAGPSGGAGGMGGSGDTGAGGTTTNSPPPGTTTTGDTSGETTTSGDTETTTGTPTSSEPEPTLVSSGEGTYWQLGTIVEATDGAASVVVDDAQEFQTWEGFGGSFNEAGWDALGEVSEAERERAIRLLFDSQDGAGFDWGRIPIGASDYALDRYVLMDGDPTQPDPMMERFSIQRDRQHLIPFVQAALAVKPDLRLWASPWTPPPWMKSPAQFDGYVNDQSSAAMRNDATVLEAYALYFVKFIQEYASEGIHIEHVQPQNEPGYTTRYPSCSWSGSLMATFIGDHLGPAFEQHGLETEIWLGTLSNDSTATDFIDSVFAHPAASQYVNGVGLQWNTSGRVPSLAERGIHVMQTEHRCGNYRFTVQGLPYEPRYDSEQPHNDHLYGLESWRHIRDWIQQGVHSYFTWNMVLDSRGHNLDSADPWPQNALLVVDRERGELGITPAYYVFRHVAQFVDPGAVRLGVMGSNDALAFKNPDGSIVAVLHNSGNQDEQVTVGIREDLLQVSVPARGWTTINR